MTNIVCEVTYVKKSNQTSILTVKLNDISTKCMKVVSKIPEEWVENIILSRCCPKCEELWKTHVKESIEENTQQKTKSIAVLGYDVSPDLIFETKTVYSENADGTSEINIDVDPLFTKCMDTIYINPIEEIKSFIQSRIEIEIDNIINDSINRGINIDKTKREIIMTYEREEITDEFIDELDDDIVDENVKSKIEEDLQTTRTQLEGELQTTRTQLEGELQTTRTQLEGDLQAEKEKTQQLEVRLTLLESTLASLIS